MRKEDALKLTFLGGADEIGASCSLLELAGHRLLIDCGIRLSPRQGEVLPWLAKVEEVGGIDAILQTHAHLDHSGALPVAHSSFKAPLYMTAPTLSIITTLLSDALKIMEAGHKAEGELPIYSPLMVEAMIGATRTVPFLQPIWLFEDLCLTFYPAGHILGAASLLLESSEGSVLFTGDICVTEQRTVSGLMLPPKRPDVIVIESTYGNRAHSSRVMEEKRLIEQVGEVLRRRGAVLIPAFAIGRAQEVILILSQAMEKKELPRAPIYVDGMVKSVCSIYASYPEYVSPWLRQRMQSKNPFFYPDGPAVPIWDPKDREKAVAQRPCIIVSSSGMLSGGPSVFYAHRLAQDPNSLIAMTGYQDEESPGRKLQEIAAKGGGELVFSERSVKVSCKVATYSLSAHSDASQILSEIEALRPKEVVLVHGYPDAKDSLEQNLKERRFEVVHRPRLGETLDIQPRERRTLKRPEVKPPEEFRPLQEEDRTTLAQRLLARDSTSRIYPIQELLAAWGYPPEQVTQEELARVAKLFSGSSSPFVRDGKRAFLYRIRTIGTKVFTKEEKLSTKVPTSTQQQALDLINAAFPPSTGLYKKSVVLGNRSIVLSFYFPAVAERKYADDIEKLQGSTPWQLKINPDPHQQALVDAVLRWVPEPWRVLKRPSLHVATSKVTVAVGALGPIEEVEEKQRGFLEETGFVLHLEEVRGAVAPAKVVPSDQATQRPTQMEVNAACQQIREAFERSPHPVLKVSVKQQPRPFLEVYFISPKIGQRYTQALQQLSQEIGWEIQLRKTADQHQIKEIAKRLTQKLGPQKEPSFRPEASLVEIKVGERPSPAEGDRLSREFEESTGFRLLLL